MNQNGDSNESFVDTFGSDGVSSMALELKESINYAIADLNHWLGIDIGQYLTNDEKAKGILH